MRIKALLPLTGIAVLASCATGPAPAAPAAAAAAAELPAVIREELIELGRQDQAAREGLTPERFQDTVFLGELMRGDARRVARLREIVDRYGWPDEARAGVAAAHAAFLVLQHGDHEFRKALLPTLQALAAAGRMPAAEVALLTDRVLVHDGLPQRYGTQFHLEDGVYVMHPVADEAGLDARRREAGLPPMTEYMRLLEEMFGAPVVRQRDR
jgi:hypothetical protein